MFWESADQAQQRLSRTVVMLGDDPVYIDRVEFSDRKDELVAYVKTTADQPRGEAISLEDPRWNNFRKLPALGLINTPTDLFLIERFPARTVKHGYGRENCGVRVYRRDAGRANLWTASPFNIFSFPLNTELKDWYAMASRKEFPSFEQALEIVSEVENRPIAFSPKHYIVKTSSGLIEMYRSKMLIGFIIDDSLLLQRPARCYREELAEVYNIQNIMEA